MDKPRYVLSFNLGAACAFVADKVGISLTNWKYWAVVVSCCLAASWIERYRSDRQNGVL